MGILAAGAALLLAVAFVATANTGEVRTWSSATGTYKTEAELVELKEDGTIVLKKKDGSLITVPLSRLSDADQQYARAQNGSESTPATAGATRSQPRNTPAEVEAEALKCRTAKDAVLMYRFYMAKPDLSDDQRAAAEAALEVWQKKATDNLVRVGTQWMPEKDAEKIRERADAKIEHAMELLRLRNGELARKTLEDAAKLDPDSIKADFLMGIVYGLLADNDQKAQQHFERCLDREPNNVSVLNNLAVTLVFQKKYAQAAQHWKTAAGSAPKMKELSQNIGSLITMAGSPGYKVPPRALEDLSLTYEDLISNHGNPRPTRIGFVYTPPYGADWSEKQGGGGGKTESVVVSSGSGFVVHPQIILTNRHVIEGASGLLVLDPKNSKGEPLPAELIAISNELDLALIRCKTLNAPPVALVETLPPRGTDIMVLGFPLGPSFGTSLKSTRGAMVAMPDASVDNMCLFDAITNPGNSGGPLCDKAGRVAAVVRAVTGSVGGSYGAAIPISEALPFLRKHVPNLAAPMKDADELDWPGVDAKVSPSTVLILSKEDLQTDAGVGDGTR